MTSIQIKPISSRQVEFDSLSAHQQEAIEAASEMIAVPSNAVVTVEVYRMADIRQMVEEAWGWPCSLKRMRGENYTEDRKRVRTIIGLLRQGEPVWPYVSYWASDIQELAQVEEQDDGTSVINHGDGWHRIVAAVEQGREQVEIIFL